MMMVMCGSTLTNVNFDADRFPVVIKQAIDYREQLKKLYESECKRVGTTPRRFTQSEATWMPDVDMWVGSTEQLEAEGTEWLINIVWLLVKSTVLLTAFAQKVKLE